jgi:uncharacterized protein YhbP (UPF0306 family)
MSTETAQRIADFLDAHHVMSLATCGAAGPHAACVFYAREGFTLLWVSDSQSRHSTELAADCRVSATVAADYASFSDIRGLQISGRARLITDESECADARAVFEMRYPWLKDDLSAAAETQGDAYARAGFYRLEPDRLVLIDNTLGFGHKETLVR